MSYETSRIVGVKGNVIKIAHLELPEHPSTVLTADVSAAGVTLTVLDNAGFVNAQKILIGELGKEQTEIKVVNAAVTAGTSLTSTAVTFAHPGGTNIKRILFDQWRVYGNTTNTTVGATLIATIDVQVDAPHTTYVNTGTEYAYYFVLPYDSAGTLVSTTYSDGVSNSTSYVENSVGALMESALDGAKTKIGGRITTAFIIQEINDCLRFITGKLKRWSFLQVFDYITGQVTRGTFSVALPTDMEDTNSIKSILGLRVGSGENLIYKDKREWETKLEGVNKTQVRTQAAVGDVTLVIDNSYDFADSGSVNVYVSGVQYNITYTGVTRSSSAGVLTGVPASGTGSITVIIPVDTNVWQGEEEGVPTYFTVYDGSAYIWPLPDASNDNANIYIDYHSKKTSVDTAGDIIEPPRYDAVKHWLIWKLRAQKNASAVLDMNDGDKKMFDTILNDQIRREVSGQKFKRKPRYNSITY